MKFLQGLIFVNGIEKKRQLEKVRCRGLITWFESSKYWRDRQNLKNLVVGSKF